MTTHETTEDDESDHPPLYPFPSDDILWALDDPSFDLSADSWFALGELPDDDVRIFNGREHVNPYRLAIRTPVRGSWAMYVNTADLAHLFALAMVGMATDDSGMYSPTDEETFVFSPSYWESFAGINIEIAGGDDE